MLILTSEGCVVKSNSIHEVLELYSCIVGDTISMNSAWESFCDMKGLMHSTQESPLVWSARPGITRTCGRVLHPFSVLAAVFGGCDSPFAFVQCWIPASGSRHLCGAWINSSPLEENMRRKHTSASYCAPFQCLWHDWKGQGARSAGSVVAISLHCALAQYQFPSSHERGFSTGPYLLLVTLWSKQQSTYRKSDT